MTDGNEGLVDGAGARRATFCLGVTALWFDHRDFYRSCRTCDFLNCLPIGWDCCPVVSDASRDLFGCDDTGQPGPQPREASCDLYYVGTTCEWTQTYACPGTPRAELPGALVASDDGSLGYHCCCLHSAPPMPPSSPGEYSSRNHMCEVARSYLTPL